MKSFADDKLNFTQDIKLVFQTVKNIVEKGENAGNQHFLLFPQCFQEALPARVSKVIIMWKKDNLKVVDEDKYMYKPTIDGYTPTQMICLLISEKSMEILFDNGKGEIFTESLKWLESKEEHLQLSGALAVGNFARSGNNSNLELLYIYSKLHLCKSILWIIHRVGKC